MPAGALGPTKATVPPEQNVVAPVVAIVAVGNALTLNIIVALEEQDPEVTVYVIVVEPTD
jgi:hypothetical protein